MLCVLLGGGGMGGRGGNIECVWHPVVLFLVFFFLLASLVLCSFVQTEPLWKRSVCSLGQIVY